MHMLPSNLQRSIVDPPSMIDMPLDTASKPPGCGCTRYLGRRVGLARFASLDPSLHTVLNLNVSYTSDFEVTERRKSPSGFFIFVLSSWSTGCFLEMEDFLDFLFGVAIGARGDPQLVCTCKIIKIL